MLQPEFVPTMSTTTTETRSAPITADNILRLFPDIDTSGEALEGHDEEQIRLMDEVCIVLDENDLPIGTASKKLCKLRHARRELHATPFNMRHATCRVQGRDPERCILTREPRWQAIS